MFFIVVAVWLVGVVISFINGNRKMPLIVLLLGLGIIAGTFMGMLGYFGLAGMAILAAVIWIANKVDMV